MEKIEKYGKKMEKMENNGEKSNSNWDIFGDF